MSEEAHFNESDKQFQILGERTITPKVTRIEPTIDIKTLTTINSIQKRRVCAYARVSTSSDEQENSYAAQVDYYQKFIQLHAGWEFAGIYADEGITGTSTKNRIGFNKMTDELKGFFRQPETVNQAETVKADMPKRKGRPPKVKEPETVETETE